MNYSPENIFGRINENGNVNILFIEDGDAVTRVETDLSIYSVDDDRHIRTEHPQGIEISKEDAEKLGVEIEQ